MKLLEKVGKLKALALRIANLLPGLGIVFGLNIGMDQGAMNGRDLWRFFEGELQVWNGIFGLFEHRQMNARDGKARGRDEALVELDNTLERGDCLLPVSALFRLNAPPWCRSCPLTCRPGALPGRTLAPV